jgi:glyoxylase-like metal-dependent hydrolase (beta-lactamase superfamily II)
MLDSQSTQQRNGVLASLNMVADALKLLPTEKETTKRWSTRPDSAKAAYEALRAYAPNLPELTTVFITHSHWDHAGGHTYFRALNPRLSFYARSNSDFKSPRHYIRASGCWAISPGQGSKCVYSGDVTRLEGTACWFYPCVSA